MNMDDEMKWALVALVSSIVALVGVLFFVFALN